MSCITLNIKPRPNARYVLLDNARYFVESNVESVWPPCRVLLSFVERCQDKFEQVRNCRVVTLDISIVSSVRRLSSAFGQADILLDFCESTQAPLSSPFLPFSRLRE